jgi:CubicO group peptidase (beta-lactamase class C family)
MIPGVMVLLRTPQNEFMVSYGTTKLGVTIPPGADTHFRIASNTKTMTAAVIVQLAQEGEIGLDDPVSKYIPGVPNGENITIAELLKMRSGLYNYTDAPELSASLDRDPTKVWTADEVLSLAFKHPPLRPPNEAFHYSNTNYALLGLVAEKLEDKPLASIFQDRLFRPLGMRDTALPAPTSNTLPEPYSHGYLYGSSSYALVDAPYPADLRAAAEAGTLEPNDDTDQNPSYASAAGGVISTADDLATWIRALVGGKVLIRFARQSRAPLLTMTRDAYIPFRHACKESLTVALYGLFLSRYLFRGFLRDRRLRRLGGSNALLPQFLDDCRRHILSGQRGNGERKNHQRYYPHDAASSLLPECLSKIPQLRASESRRCAVPER